MEQVQGTKCRQLQHKMRNLEDQIVTEKAELFGMERKALLVQASAEENWQKKEDD